MTVIAPQENVPDQFGRSALVLFVFACLFGFLRSILFAHFMFWILTSGGVALTAYSLIGRPMGSPRRETWFAALLFVFLLGSILAR